MLCYISREYMYLDMFCMYFDSVSQRSPRYTLGYMSDTSRFMYLAHFLGVTLDTYQDTSGYVYPRLVITIHQDTPRYKITIQYMYSLRM